MDARIDVKVEDVFGPFPELRTARLRLRRVAREDAEPLYAYGSDPEVSRFVGWDTYQSIADAEAYIEATIAKYDNRNMADWAIEHVEDGVFIGTVGFVWWQTAVAAAEIGYVMAKPYWGRGLMTEVVREVMKFGWDRMLLNRIQAQVQPENAGSQRVLEKCGFLYEGRQRERARSEGRFVDLLLYAALRSERAMQTEV
ncbi:MAG: GNAT family N-acetyltransferase [Thermomicrobiales bacterium]